MKNNTQINDRLLNSSTNVKEHAPPQKKSDGSATEELNGGCCVSSCCASSFGVEDAKKLFNDPLVGAIKTEDYATSLRLEDYVNLDGIGDAFVWSCALLEILDTENQSGSSLTQGASVGDSPSSSGNRINRGKF
jgi:hypothetical protein